MATYTKPKQCWSCGGTYESANNGVCPRCPVLRTAARFAVELSSLVTAYTETLQPVDIIVTLEAQLTVLRQAEGTKP